MKYFGCSYYPEYWGGKRLQEDIKLMLEAGINIVRIGEFAWGKLEPAEGKYDFLWLHNCIKEFQKNNIDVILCTPTAAPPSWLTYNYPQTLIVKVDGSKVQHGARRHYCPTVKKYRDFCDIIVEKLSQEFSIYDNVVAWQIDNEPDVGEKGICYCESCQSAFRKWLKNKYESIENLNEKWGNAFWSIAYTDFEQITIALKKPDYEIASSRKLDSARFVSDQMVNFILRQAEIIRKNHPKAIVSTNMSGCTFTDINFMDLFDNLDIAFKDLYFDACVMSVNSLQLSQMRSAKVGRKYWLNETGAGALDFGRPPSKEQFRAFLWCNYINGGDAHIVFRWRTCLSGQEQELQGLLEHSEYPGKRYNAAKEAFFELKEFCKKEGTIEIPKAKVGIIHSYDVKWAYESTVVSTKINYEQNLYKICDEFYKRNVEYDVVNTNANLDEYSLVVLPSLMITNDILINNLINFSNKGGKIFAFGQIGLRDDNDNYTKWDERLENLFGCEMIGGMYLHSNIGVDEALFTPTPKTTDFSLSVCGRFGNKEISGSCAVWAGDLKLTTAKSLLNFVDDSYKGQSVFLENKNARLLSCISLCETLNKEIFNFILDDAKVEYYIDIPKHIEIKKRGKHTFIINHNNKCESIKIEQNIIELKPFEVHIK